MQLLAFQRTVVQVMYIEYIFNLDRAQSGGGEPLKESRRNKKRREEKDQLLFRPLLERL
jgi:hypothetical protein